MRFRPEDILLVIALISFVMAVRSYLTGGIPSYEETQVTHVSLQDWIKVSVPKSLPAIEAFVLSKVEVVPATNLSDGGANVTSILQAIRDSGRATATREGLVRTWAYLVAFQDAGRPFVVDCEVIQNCTWVNYTCGALLLREGETYRLHVFSVPTAARVRHLSEPPIGLKPDWADLSALLSSGDYLPPEDMWLDDWVRWNEHVKESYSGSVAG